MISSLFRFHGHNALRYVYANGKAVRSQALTIKSVANERRKHSRIAIVVSKKVIKSAVGRNRIRRRLYEYMRTRIPELQHTSDIVLIVTSAELRVMPASELKALLDELFLKADLFADPK